MNNMSDKSKQIRHTYLYKCLDMFSFTYTVKEQETITNYSIFSSGDNKEFIEYMSLLMEDKDKREFDNEKSKLFIMLFTVEEEKELFKKAKEIFYLIGEEASLSYLEKEVMLPYLTFKLKGVSKISLQVTNV